MIQKVEHHYIIIICFVSQILFLYSFYWVCMVYEGVNLGERKDLEAFSKLLVEYTDNGICINMGK